MSDEKPSDHAIQTFNTDLGQKAQVAREEVTEDDDWKQANVIVRAIGAGQNPNPEALKYLGSAVIHCYAPHTIQGMQFTTQVLLGNCPEWLASEGITVLRKDCMSAYGRKRPQKRSGY